MLDISIKALDKTIKTRKAAADFIRKHIVVVEKVDGTKLTLIRNGEKFDPLDYTKNWLVSYKGSIIYPTEFYGLEKRQDVKQKSLGTAQYKFVHDHLASVHPDTASIPKNTEFFIEFVQNKPTTTRDYAKKHGLFLVGFGPASYAESRGFVYTTSLFKNDPALLQEYAETLQLGQFPVVYEGNLSSRSEIFDNSDYLDPGLRHLFAKSLETIDFSDPQEILSGVVSAFREMQSSLGGQAEGVVIKVTGDDMTEQQLYKVLAADQHSSEARLARRMQFRMSEEEEKKYWDEVKEKVDEILDELGDSAHDMPSAEVLRRLSTRIYSMSADKLGIEHPLKALINIQEDILLTAKIRIFSYGHRMKKIAIIPMAGKPFHRGHQELIDQAEADGNQLILVFISTTGREEISTADMVPLWRDFYFPAIQREYGGKVFVKFTDISPIREVRSAVPNLVRQTPETVVSLYGDEDDAPQRVQDVLESNPEFKGRLVARSIPRSLTSGISGTSMRQLLASGNRDEFINGLPSFLNEKEKAGIWSALSSKITKPTNENLLRRYVRSILGT